MSLEFASGNGTTSASHLRKGLRADFSLVDRKVARFLFGSLDKRQLRRVVRGARIAARHQLPGPFVITDVDYETKTVTFGSAT